MTSEFQQNISGFLATHQKNISVRPLIQCLNGIIGIILITGSLPVVMDFMMDNVAEGKLQGFLAFDPGSAFVGLLVGCVFVFIIDNKWLNAAITNVVALALTGIGMIHSPGLLFTDTYSPDLAL